MTQLKSFFAPIDDSFKKTFESSLSIFIKEKLCNNNVKFYEIKKVLIKQNNRRKDIEYLSR